MKNLFIFLLIALISTYVIKPTNKSRIWVSTFLVPLVTLIIYGLIIGLVLSPYVSGKEVIMSVVPAIIAGIVIYFQMKKKFENENIVKFPIVLVVFIGLSLIGSIVQYTLETKTRKFMQEYSNNNDQLNSDTYSKQKETNKRSQLLSLSYNGASFLYPNEWKVETEVLQENFAFNISCERKELSSDILTIIWVNDTNSYTTTEMIENNLSGMRESILRYESSLNEGEIYKSVFKGRTSDCLEYDFTLSGEKYYGKICSFYIKGNTVAISKQSDTKDKLNTEFQVMEESFELK